MKGWEITPTQVAFDIPCTQPVFYVSVHEFIGWIDDELRQCRYLTENKPQATADRYKLLLPHVVDRHKVRMADPSYVAGAFRFQLEYENILTLLMDKSFYPDPSLFLRELLQNALDACRRKEADMQVKGIAYTPKIVVWDKTDDPIDPRVIFQDNGVGMSQRIVEQYFLRIGRSYYRSPEFDAERQRLREQGKELDACSQFGIGILSCFLVGDRFEVETHQEGYEPLHIVIEGPSKYFVVRRLAKPEPSVLYQTPSSDEEDGPPKRAGTRITAHFRPGAKVGVWRTLDKFAANVDYPIVVQRAGWKGPHTIEALRWEKPIRVANYQFNAGSGDALEEVLIASRIPFSEWPFSRHIRGCSWFWLLRGPEGQPAPNAGFLEVDSSLRLVGVPLSVANLEGEYEIEYSARKISFVEWVDQKRVDFRGKDKDLFSEIIARRSRVLKHVEDPLHWAEHPVAIKALLSGSIEWADQPVRLGAFFPRRESVDISEEEDRIALHSIRVPAGIVKWSPTEASSEKVEMRALFGGLRIDVRGMQAPRPAAHRLFVPEEGAADLRHQYLHAALLHGVSLVEQYGRTPPWRRWFCELAKSALRRGLKRAEFAKSSGQQVEDACGLAARVNKKTKYLSRAEILALTSGPIYLVDERQASQGLLRDDPVNKLLYSADAFTWEENVELDLSNYPIARKKK